MIETKQALELALDATSQRLQKNMVVNIIVEPKTKHYLVTLIPISSYDVISVDTVIVKVDRDSGFIITTDEFSGPNPRRELVKRLRDKRIITGLQAYEIALNLIKGYENYDQFGRLEVKLDKDHFKITLPHTSARNGVGRTSDYAYQIWIDANTKEVIKVLTSS